MHYQHLSLNNSIKIENNTEDNTITIHAGDSKNRLSDIIKDFPDNCYVNKQITGCGGTTLVLRNDVEYVVLVPYVNLLLSKLSDNLGKAHIIGLYSETETQELQDFLTDTSKPRKIVCTFDSLPRLLKTKGFDPKQFKLLVDEAHTLVNLGSFKAAVCEFVLQNYTKFQSYVFLTATPTKRSYFPDMLKDLPLCTIEWQDVRPVKFNLQTLEVGTGLNNALFGLCYDYLMGKVKGNAHIFYNSVTEISTVLNKLKGMVDKDTGENIFNSSDIRVVCSKAKENQKTFNSRLGLRWAKISDIRDPVAKINFYTSTAFEGADVLDEEGQTYIIINGVRDATKVDFHLLVPQIVGRIRNTKYNEHIHILVGNLPEAASVTKEEWTKKVQIGISESKDRLDFLRNPPASVPAVVIKGAKEDALSDKYTFLDAQGELYVSDVAEKAELQAYEALEATYVVRAVEGAEYIDDGYSASFKDLLTDTSKHTPFAHKPEGIAKFINGSTQCFTETMKEYCEARDDENSTLIKLVDNKDDYFRMFYDSLGHPRIKALEYRRANLERVYKVQDQVEDNNTMIKALLNLKNDEVILRQDLKIRLQGIYDKMNIDQLAKATDVSKWYEVKDTRLKSRPAYKVVRML